MKTSALLLLNLLQSATLCTAAAAADDTIHGVVLSARGAPAPGVEVGTTFRLEAAGPEPRIAVQIGYGEKPLLSDANGRFEIARSAAYTGSLVARAGDGTSGYAALPPSGAGMVLQLRAPSSLALHIQATSGWTSTVGFELLSAESVLGYARLAQGDSRLVVPSGSLRVQAYEPESVLKVAPVEAEPGRVASVRLALEPTPWARQIGKPAPALTPTETRGLAGPFRMEALRGKWVLVDFWATWCKQCVEEMPDLIRFVEDHQSLRDRFAVLAVHSPDGRDFAAIQPAYDRLVQQAWSGKDLPFALLFDRTGATHERWGISSYPTSILVDPEGKVVGWATAKDLERALREDSPRARAPGRPGHPGTEARASTSAASP